MTIVPIPLKNSSSVVEFFRQDGKVEIPRPPQCFYELCGLKQPLRGNGSYERQVIYWGLFFVVQIFRFRCKRCGKTASCPYGWLVPYRRFPAELVAAGVQAYADKEITYRDQSADLSDLELSEPEMDIRDSDLCKTLVKESASKQPGAKGEPPIRPAHTSVFNWVAFVCARTEALLTQIQKELVQEMKRGKEEVLLPPESLVENPNSYKSATVEKAGRLDRLSFATFAADQLLHADPQLWCGLRAYFLTKAQSRKDLLTDVRVRLPITHTSELAIF